MKKFSILILLLSFLKVHSQKSEFEGVFKETKAKADSSNIVSDEVEVNVYTIKQLQLFRDKLLINDNYKSKVKVNTFISKYSIFLPSNFNEKQISSPILINKFYRDQEDLYYAKSALLLAKLLIDKARDGVEAAKERIDYIEESLILTLQYGNYPIEKYNKLTEKEKKEIIQKIYNDYNSQNK